MKLRLSILFLTLALLLAGLCSAEEHAPVRIAIIDTGISTLAIDPSSVAEGRNYIRPDLSTEDLMGHGTAVASLIVGSTSAGISGICPDAILVPLVIESLDTDDFLIQCDIDTIASVVRDAVDIYDCDIINMSLAFLDESDALAEAIAYAHEQGVLVVASSGNRGSYALYYPGAYPTVLCVGTVSQDGTTYAKFSNRSKYLDLIAPGVDVLMAGIYGELTTNSGTSFSAAHVTGAAAKLMMQYPTYSATQIQRILCSSATDLLTHGFDIRTGWGILNLENAMHYAAVGRQYRDFPDDLWFSYNVPLLASPSAQNSTVSRAQLWVMLHAMSGEKADPEAATWYETAQNWVQATGIADGEFPRQSLTYAEVLDILSAYAAHIDREIAFDLPLPLESRATREQISELLTPFN